MHRNIELLNMWMGLWDSEDTVFLVNFGISTLFRYPSTRIHIPMVGLWQTNRNTGLYIPEWTSWTEVSRWDDLESLGYSLLLLCKGSLP